MKTSEAIKLGIENGYKEGDNWIFVNANRYCVVWLNGNKDEVTINTSVYFLDPQFWIALWRGLSKGKSSESTIEKAAHQSMREFYESH